MSYLLLPDFSCLPGRKEMKFCTWSCSSPLLLSVKCLDMMDKVDDLEMEAMAVSESVLIASSVSDKEPGGCRSARVSRTGIKSHGYPRVPSRWQI